MASKFFLAVTLLLAIAMLASAQSCAPNYTPVNGVCVLNCQAAHCDICDPHDTTHTACATCSFGYLLTPSKTCTPACSIANCVTCSSSGNNACQECAPGYLRTAKGLCRRSGNSASTVASVAVASTILAASLFAIAA